MPAVDAAEMREVDRIAVSETGPSLVQMMENAGRNLAELVMETSPSDWSDREIVVLAGTGGNGGGGIAAGRHLTNHGGRVATFITNSARLAAVPSKQLGIFKAAGGRVGDGMPEDADLVIDAVIGYSLQGAPRENARAFINWANRNDAPVISLDIPSGLNATTEETPGEAVAANATMTLALPKIGLCSHLAGDLVLADIGIPALTYRSMGRPEASAVFDGRYRVPLTRNLSPDD